MGGTNCPPHENIKSGIAFVKFLYDHTYSNDILFTNNTAYTPNKSFSVDEIAGVFRTLAYDEWKYLFGETEQRKGRYAYDVTINDGSKDHFCCLLIAPDECLDLYVFDAGKKAYSATEWAEAVSAGVVCLPQTGIRPEEEEIIDCTREMCLYWASDCDSENGGYGFECNCNSVSFSSMYRGQGMCIRLVADLK